MKVAIDYDDTLDQCPEFFADLSAAVKAAGGEVHIVTHITEFQRPIREEELKHNNIQYDVLACTGDKLGYCEKVGIDFAFDDVGQEYFKRGADGYFPIWSFKKKRKGGWRKLPPMSDAELANVVGFKDPESYYVSEYQLINTISYVLDNVQRKTLKPLEACRAVRRLISDYNKHKMADYDR
jgi:hypothetical protein